MTNEAPKEILMDLEHFQSFTGGDPELSKMLITAFIESGDQDMNKITAFINDSGSGWKEAMHSFKGASFTLGANKLGDFLKEAEYKTIEEIELRKTLYDQIKAEYDKLKTYITETFLK